MRNQLITTLMFGGLTLLVAGCSDNHYRVTDPTSGTTYYTTKINDAGRGGAVKIKDEKTGSIVTLQSSEVKPISEEEYEAGMAAKAATKPVAEQPPSAVRPATPQAAPAQPTPQAVPAQP